MTLRIGNTVKTRLGMQGTIHAVSGTDRTCMVLLTNGQWLRWVREEDLTLIPPTEDE